MCTDDDDRTNSPKSVSASSWHKSFRNAVKCAVFTVFSWVWADSIMDRDGYQIYVGF